jgi:hypothetical protein
MGLTLTVSAWPPGMRERASSAASSIRASSATANGVGSEEPPPAHR